MLHLRHILHIVAGSIAATSISVSICACKGRTEMPTEDDVINCDSAIVDSTVIDSIETEVEVIPPKKADELFDDFAFAFMKNRYFQKQRIVFPLPYTDNEEQRNISAPEWQYDPMYSQSEMYTLIFDSHQAEKAAKDTTLREVVVEELNLETHNTKSYDFKRIDGEWRLTALSNIMMTKSANSDFYTFYHRFATDKEYQQRHIADPLEFSTFDDDAFEMVEGVIAAEQFNEFAPELPTSKITNILYGQAYKNSNLRILSLRALAGGMECTMTFKRIDGEWQLTRLEN